MISIITGCWNIHWSVQKRFIRCPLWWIFNISHPPFIYPLANCISDIKWTYIRDRRACFSCWQTYFDIETLVAETSQDVLRWEWKDHLTEGDDNHHDLFTNFIQCRNILTPQRDSSQRNAFTVLCTRCDCSQNWRHLSCLTYRRTCWR